MIDNFECIKCGKIKNMDDIAVKHCAGEFECIGCFGSSIGRETGLDYSEIRKDAVNMLRFIEKYEGSEHQPIFCDAGNLACYVLALLQEIDKIEGIVKL